MQDIRFKEGAKSAILKSLDPEMAELTTRFNKLNLDLEMSEAE
jgi:hypothetical protein